MEREYFCSLTLLPCKSKLESISISNTYSNYFKYFKAAHTPKQLFYYRNKARNQSSLVEGMLPLRHVLFWGFRVAMKKKHPLTGRFRSGSSDTISRALCTREAACRTLSKLSEGVWTSLGGVGGGSDQFICYLSYVTLFSFSVSSWFALWLKQLANISGTVFTSVTATMKFCSSA